MTGDARFFNTIPADQSIRTSLHCSQELARALDRYTRSRHGCKTALIRKILFDLDRFLDSHDSNIFNEVLLESFTGTIATAETCAHLNLSVEASLYNSLRKRLPKQLPALLRFILFSIIQGIETTGVTFLYYTLNEATTLEYYIPALALKLSKEAPADAPGPVGS